MRKIKQLTYVFSKLELFAINSLLILFLIFPLNAQFSPGKLAQAHAHLEGNKNCTQCHELGKNVTAAKCLNCHTDLNERIQANKGYHVSSAVKPKNCIECHSDHNGVNYKLIKLDESNFKHELTGYRLEGAHTKVDCRSCHKPENITNSNLKKNPKTFLGLSGKCNQCHLDPHQNTLSNSCNNCHNQDKFKPAALFNHQKANFALKGAHLQVACLECHPKEIKAGKDFQKFKGVSYTNCSSCHKDEHKGRYGNQCKACHTEESFSKILPNSSFNHALTGYKLEGKHRSLDCKLCHDKRHGAGKMFQEFIREEMINCILCHKDVHDGKFGTDCKKCHTVDGFKIQKVQNLESFDHALTAFPLEGKHKAVECKACHKGSMTDPVAHQYCKNCHKDYHNGEFNHLASNDCSRCHSVHSFKESSFSLDDHQLSKFPLKGSHAAISCDQCHYKQSKWNFKNIGEKCVDCHKDIHRPYIDSKYYPNQECALCHQEETWAKIQFDHQKTSFPLTGKHIETACRKCHFKEVNSGQSQVFKNLTHKCDQCHTNSHYQQFDIQGYTDCTRCHTTANWLASEFSHDSARFVLTGQHIVLTCNRCHFPENRDGVSYILYRNGKLECRDCHK